LIMAVAAGIILFRAFAQVRQREPQGRGAVAGAPRGTTHSAKSGTSEASGAGASRRSRRGGEEWKRVCAGLPWFVRFRWRTRGLWVVEGPTWKRRRLERAAVTPFGTWRLPEGTPRGVRSPSPRGGSSPTRWKILAGITQGVRKPRLVGRSQKGGHRRWSRGRKKSERRAKRAVFRGSDDRHHHYRSSSSVSPRSHRPLSVPGRPTQGPAPEGFGCVKKRDLLS